MKDICEKNPVKQHAFMAAETTAFLQREQVVLCLQSVDVTRMFMMGLLDCTMYIIAPKSEDQYLLQKVL